MARPLRPRIHDHAQHVTWRGVRKQPLFLDARDALRFLEFLDAEVERREWQCHAYCLMPNHVHLVVTTPKADLPEGMQRLGTRYAMRLNRRYGHKGHVFERRYWSNLVLRDEYFLELIRYVCLNPVRAGLCRSPEDWPWSSYRATIGALSGGSRAGFAETAAHFGSRRALREFVATA